MVTSSEPLVLNAIGEHTATVIIVHGLAESCHTWAKHVEHWRLNGTMDHVKFILPDAPVRPLTVGQGATRQAWFDILYFDGSSESIRENEDVNGIEVSKGYIQRLIQAEIESGTASERIVLVGFSQGAAISILAALTGDHKLGGIVSLSSWLVRYKDFESLLPEENPNRQVPILMGHGIDDRMVPVGLGKQSFDDLRRMGFSPCWEVYPGVGHETCEDELEDVEAFLQEQLGLH
ncbi:hypothetical protein S7711_04895 [Stachybotrys chartarum IBT 7711]|uniref:Acyl-protein thioesterase 1 n=1 Tax=Stachybotrys chartarum (strain CBS 109288 / IBT 7711) TaxID=1280523 RepID=A0A084B6G8_STACB|nr:hypothetical protein S7711_04895 [Stachybotrys chartarum IBT 7711]